jgi:hypothetical protein
VLHVKRLLEEILTFKIGIRNEILVIGKQKCSENGNYDTVKMGTRIQ